MPASFCAARPEKSGPGITEIGSAPKTWRGNIRLLSVHYEQLAKSVASTLDYDLSDVTGDLLAVSAEHRWDPTNLSDAQAEQAHFEVIARIETTNSVLYGPDFDN